MGCTVGKTTIDSSINDGKRKDFNENIPHLSDAHKQTVKNNWQVLKQHVANIGVITYVSMFENRPELIEVFANFKGKHITELQNSGLLRQHALRVMATIDKCITRIDEPASMIYILREVGFHHKRYHVQPDNIQIILPHFLSAIKYHIRDSWHEDLQEAWVSFLSLIFYHIKEGYAPLSYLCQYFGKHEHDYNFVDFKRNIGKQQKNCQQCFKRSVSKINIVEI